MTDEEEKQKNKDEHDKQLEVEHSKDLKTHEQHLKSLNKEAADIQRKDERLERILESIERSRGTGGAALRGLIARQNMRDTKDLNWQGLGRDVHDFLTARQHGWDRASGPSGPGAGDRMP